MKSNSIMIGANTFQFTKNFLRNLAILGLVLSLIFGLSGCQEPEKPTVPDPTETSPVTSSPALETATVEPTFTPLPSSTPEPTPTFDISSVEDWGSGRLLFDLEEHNFGEKIHQGIYELDLETGTLAKISGAGSVLLDISPDHLGLLASQEETLSVIDLETGTSQKLAGDYFHLSPSGAKWDHSTNTIYYLTRNGSEIFLARVNPANGGAERLPISSAIAVLSADRNTITLGIGTCNPFGDCAISELLWTDGGGNQIASVEVSESIPLPCQRPSDFVYSEKDENGGLSLHIRPHGQEQETVFWSLKTEYADCAWSPDGNRLAVILIDRNWYSGEIQAYYFQLLIPATNEILDLSRFQAPLDLVSWSPDGRYTAFTGTAQNGDGYQIEINLFNINSLSVTRFNQLDQFQSENYLTVHALFWSP